jgi:hypothetical protein
MVVLSVWAKGGLQPVADLTGHAMALDACVWSLPALNARSASPALATRLPDGPASD